MTKKQVIFWRVTLILIIILSGSFYLKNIFKSENKENINLNKANTSIVESKENQVIEAESKAIQHNGEIELNIRPENFYKK